MFANIHGSSILELVFLPPLRFFLFFTVCACRILCQDGRAALMMASAEGHTATVQLLVDAGADKDARDKVHRK